jgi:hypothetical protein
MAAPNSPPSALGNRANGIGAAQVAKLVYEERGA